MFCGNAKAERGLSYLFQLRTLESNSEEGLKVLQMLLQEASGTDSAVRVGDIFSMIIEYHARNYRWKQVHIKFSLSFEDQRFLFPLFFICKAYNALTEMREHVAESAISYYIDPKLLVIIHREMNIEYKGRTPGQMTNSINFDEDDIRDDVAYGTYDD